MAIGPIAARFEVCRAIENDAADSVTEEGERRETIAILRLALLCFVGTSRRREVESGEERSRLGERSVNEEPVAREREREEDKTAKEKVDRV